MSYVIAAYTVVIGSLVLYGLWLEAGRRAVAKQEAVLLGRGDRASGEAPSADSAVSEAEG